MLRQSLGTIMETKSKDSTMLPRTISQRVFSRNAKEKMTKSLTQIIRNKKKESETPKPRLDVDKIYDKMRRSIELECSVIKKEKSFDEVQDIFEQCSSKPGINMAMRDELNSIQHKLKIHLSGLRFSVLKK